MKYILSIIFKIFIEFIIFLFPPKRAVWLRNRFNKFYTLWKISEFKQVGREIKLQYPIYVSGSDCISIGDKFRCDQRLRLEAIKGLNQQTFEPTVQIGNNVCIQKDCHIAAINKIVIGDNVLIASKVYIGDHSHGEINKEDLLLPPGARSLYSKGPVILENNVWIGEGVIILPGVHIGENCVIGAGSVVTKDCENNSIYVGNPAKKSKSL